jgi:CRP-like cAMP-binding protein
LREQHLLLAHLRTTHFGPDNALDGDALTDQCLFLESGAVSLLVAANGQPPVEVGLVGPEGMVGLRRTLCDEPAEPMFRPLTECTALAIDARALEDFAAAHPLVQRTLARYAGHRLAQAMQRGACHLKHGLEQRLADWILAATDLVGSTRLTTTHGQLSRLLGATRPSVTLAVQSLEGHRAIRATRNLICVRSRATLESLACGCHQGSAPSRTPRPF